MTGQVLFRMLDGVAVATLDVPPANTLSVSVRAALWEALERVDSDPEITSMVLNASGETFSIGADIGECDGSIQRPTLAQLCDRIEGCSKPVVATIQGKALGGGAELALAAHYRVAAQNSRVGLPEVALGLIANAGGTQRLTRLIGAQRALQMFMSTRSIDAASAQAFGLVDAVMKGDLTSGAITFAKRLVERGDGPRRTCDNRTHLMDGRAHQVAVNAARKTLVGRPAHAQMRAVECVEMAALLPFQAALAFEADAFARCLDDPQSVALRHIFRAERQTAAAFIEREGTGFRPTAPTGIEVVARLRTSMSEAIEHLVTGGISAGEIDGAMVAYGFRRGPFGGKEVGTVNGLIEHAIIGALVVEGCACVEQHAVQRPSDIDVLAVHGLGFPRMMGGPMRAAQTIGLIGVRKELRVLSEHSYIWAVPDLLDQAIKDARGFDALA